MIMTNSEFEEWMDSYSKSLIYGPGNTNTTSTHTHNPTPTVDEIYEEISRLRDIINVTPQMLDLSYIRPYHPPININKNRINWDTYLTNVGGGVNDYDV